MSNYRDKEKQRETQRRWREKNRDHLREYQNQKYGAEYKKKWRAEHPEASAEADANSRERLREKQRAYAKKYYRTHREQALKDSHDRYLQNRDAVKARSAAWRAAHPEEFRAYLQQYYRDHREDALASGREYYRENSDQVKARSAEWRRNNPERAKASRDKRRTALFEWWYGEVLPQLKCQDCGMSDTDCLDFHHRPGTKRSRNHNPTTMLYGASSRERIEHEMALCDVLCANCHRKRHAEMRRNE